MRRILIKGPEQGGAIARGLVKPAMFSLHAFLPLAGGFAFNAAAGHRKKGGDARILAHAYESHEGDDDQIGHVHCFLKPWFRTSLRVLQLSWGDGSTQALRPRQGACILMNTGKRRNGIGARLAKPDHANS